MAETDTPDLTPDPAERSGKNRIPMAVGALCAVVAIGAGGYVAVNAGEEEVAPQAADMRPEPEDTVVTPETVEVTVEAPERRPDEQDRDDDDSNEESSSAGQESTGAGSQSDSRSHPPRLEGVGPSMNTSSTPRPAGTSGGGGSDSDDEPSQYSPDQPVHERQTRVDEVSMDLPDDVQAALDAEEDGTTDDDGDGDAATDEHAPENTATEGEESAASDPVDEQHPRADEQVDQESHPDTPVDEVVPEVDAPVTEVPVEVDQPADVTAEIESTFHAVLHPGVSDDQLIAHFEAGPAVMPIAHGLAHGLPALGGAVNWHLVGPVTSDGHTADGTIVVTTPIGATEMPMTFVNNGGVWQMSSASTCALGGALLMAC